MKFQLWIILMMMINAPFHFLNIICMCGAKSVQVSHMKRSSGNVQSIVLLCSSFCSIKAIDSSTNLAAPEFPKAPTPFPAQEENKPPSHHHQPSHHQSINQSTSHSLPLPLYLLSLASILFSCSTSVPTYQPSPMR